MKKTVMNKAKDRLSFNVGQIIRSLRVNSKSEFDVWRVNGVYLGSVPGDSAIGLTPLSTRKHGEGEYLMPMMLLEIAIRSGITEII